MNNTELVEHLMTIGGRTGMMKQIFIMQAIEHHVTEIMEDAEELIAEETENEKNGKRSIISMKAYVEAAKEIRKITDNRKELFVYEPPECDATEADIY